MSWMKKSLQQLINHFESLLRMLRSLRAKDTELSRLQKRTKKCVPILRKTVLIKNTIVRCRANLDIKVQEIRLKKDMEKEEEDEEEEEEISDIEFSSSSDEDEEFITCDEEEVGVWWASTVVKRSSAKHMSASTLREHGKTVYNANDYWIQHYFLYTIFRHFILSRDVYFRQ